jgi:hypothetical protein
MKVKWAVEVEGEVYMLDLDHGDYSGRKTIKQVRAPERCHPPGQRGLHTADSHRRRQGLLTRFGLPPVVLQNGVQVYDSGMSLIDRGIEHTIHIGSHA